VRKISPEKLQAILNKHKLWLENKEGGIQADLHEADLQNVDLRFADLRFADLRCVNLQNSNLKDINFHSDNLKGANLQNSNLQDTNFHDANLKGADLRGANIDYTNIPLNCFCIGTKIDERIIRQWLYHLSKFEYIGTDEDILSLLQDERWKRVANKFHRVRELSRVL
jgi:hypothetical protein